MICRQRTRLVAVQRFGCWLEWVVAFDDGCVGVYEFVCLGEEVNTVAPTELKELLIIITKCVEQIDTPSYPTSSKAQGKSKHARALQIYYHRYPTEALEQ